MDIIHCSDMYQVGNLDGYYHFHLAKLNTSRHGNILARLSRNLTFESLANPVAILTKLLQLFTHSLNKEDSVSLSNLAYIRHIMYTSLIAVCLFTKC